MTDRVVITGFGIVSVAGRGAAATRAALREGRSGLGRLTRFTSTRCGDFPVAEVSAVTAKPRTVALAQPALFDALAMAGLERGGPAAARRALVVGTCVGGMPETEEVVPAVLAGEAVDPQVFAAHECGVTTTALADAFELRGPALTVSTACSSSAQAIASGAELLRRGAADVVVAGGTDAICRLTLHGFAALLAMDPAGCRPFDVARGGMSLGEGAAFVVLERAADAVSRGATVLAHLAGWANTCDAHHATAPDPDGRGAERAMRLALAGAGLAPAAIDYVNAHGTGTRDNDVAEGRALIRVFGAAPPCVSSTKRIFGHTLGAAGAIEAVVALLCIQDGFVPANVGCATPDPECLVTPLAAGRAQPVRAVLSNSFGFGGNNTVLCFTASGGGS